MTLYNVHGTVHDAVHGVVHGFVYGFVQGDGLAMCMALYNVYMSLCMVLYLASCVKLYIALYSIDVGHGLCMYK